MQEKVEAEKSMIEEQDSGGLKISAASFFVAIGILGGLMVFTYILTWIVPTGSYQRVLQDGRETILAGTYQLTDGGIPFWKWLLSPILVVGSPQGGTLLAVIAFLLVLGGTFNALERSGIMAYMLRRIVDTAGHRKYFLLAAVTLFFLSMGAFIGSYEEAIPMVPLAVSLAVAFGWDSLVGLGMSLGAVACGFSTGVFNPFTTGVAQPLMGLPLFSGASLRILTFVVVYGCLLLFLISYAKKCELRKGHMIDPSQVDGMQKEKPKESDMQAKDVRHEDGNLLSVFQKDPRLERAMFYFVGVIALCIVSIFACAFIPALSDYLMILVVVFFLIAGVGSSVCAGVNGTQLGKYFIQGVKMICPSVLLILMAGSVQYTMNEAGIMDTILEYAVSIISTMSPYAGILCIFLFTMIVNFFVSSGSAEAVLLMPLLGPLADLCDISRQLTVLAYNYGDGFSNLIYFTNPSLLIALSLAGVSYGKWLKWSMKLQLMIAGCCCGILLLGVMIGY